MRLNLRTNSKSWELFRCESVFRSAPEKWLPDMDLNHDKQIQSLLCYRYTIGQTRRLRIVRSPEGSQGAFAA